MCWRSPLFIAAVAFWSIHNQAFGALAVYSGVRDPAPWGRGGRRLSPAAWAQSLNGVHPARSALALRLRMGRRAPTSPSDDRRYRRDRRDARRAFTGFVDKTVPLSVIVAVYLAITLGGCRSAPSAWPPPRSRAREVPRGFRPVLPHDGGGHHCRASVQPAPPTPRRARLLLVRGNRRHRRRRSQPALLPWIRRRIDGGERRCLLGRGAADQPAAASENSSRSALRRLPAATPARAGR